MLSLVRALLDRPLNDTSTLEVLIQSEGVQLVRTRRGQAVFHEGDPSDAVYLLLEGELRCSQSGANKDAERTSLLLRAPAIFGDRDVLAGRPALESVQGLSPCRLARFDAERLLSAWAARSELRSALGLDLAVRYAASLALSAIQLETLQSFVSALLTERPGSTAAELAELTGAAPKSITRALQQAREQGPSPGPPPARPLFHVYNAPGPIE